MTDSLVIKTYKELLVQMEATRINIELYLAQKSFVSVIIDKERELYLDKKIKAAEQFLKKIKKLWKELYDMIDEVCYSSLTEKERIVFKEYFMDGYTAKEIVERHGFFESEYSIYTSATKINKMLRKIPMENYIPDVTRVMQK